jgi:hypothetical protein
VRVEFIFRAARDFLDKAIAVMARMWPKLSKNGKIRRLSAIGDRPSAKLTDSCR